jgi:hypothetical protein
VNPDWNLLPALPGNLLKVLYQAEEERLERIEMTLIVSCAEYLNEIEGEPSDKDMFQLYLHCGDELVREVQRAALDKSYSTAKALNRETVNQFVIVRTRVHASTTK